MVVLIGSPCTFIFYQIFIVLDKYYYVNVIINCFYLLHCSHSEVISYVEGIESPRVVGNKQQFKFFKFYLNNGNGNIIQVVDWNDVIEKVLSLIIPNHVNIFNFSC